MKRIRTRWRAALGGTLVFGALVTVVAVWKLFGPTGERPEVPTALKAAVVRAGEGGRIDLTEAASFAWDRVYAFPAYSTDDDVSRVLGFSWGTGATFRLPNDDFELLIFAKEQQVTGWAVMNDYESRQPVVIFDVGLLERAIPRTDSTFLIARSPDEYVLQKPPAG
jgi:hypothetical protein